MLFVNTQVLKIFRQQKIKTSEICRTTLESLTDIEDDIFVAQNMSFIWFFVLDVQAKAITAKL
jgi:hypothetical protein